MTRSARRWTLALGLLAACGQDPELGEPDAALPMEAPAVTVRRLNRVEYDNTVRDLLGTSLTPARHFPTDTHALGFDNNADALTLSPAQVTLYELAADDLVDDVRARGWAPMLACAPDRACVAASLPAFVRRAWRRPGTDADLEGLLALYDGAGDPEDGAAQVLRAVLLSPWFLFRIERDPASAVTHRVSDYELASRLSYFLWSSMPDDALLEAAAAGTLRDPEGLGEQVRRMLDDEKASSLVEHFAGQWLHLRLLDDIFRDDTRFVFDEELRTSMRTELRLLVSAFLEEDRDLRELLTTTTTFADRRLAGLYGVASAPFDGFVELDLSSRPRAGILTTPGWLALSSPPFRTSPAQRGKFVLSQLLCRPPPPPPPGATVVEAVAKTGTTRERLEAHVVDPQCAACHASLDPIGFAFEHYDAIGAWRDEDANGPVQTDGTLPTGEAFGDALELVEILAADPAFASCTVRQIYTFAGGRAPGPEDAEILDDIEAEVAAHGYGLRSAFEAVATSDAFALRRREVTP